MEDKRKYLFHLPDAQTLYLVGIYEQEQDECRYCTLTTEANESVRGVHHRMPEVLRREEVSGWITELGAFYRILKNIPPSLWPRRKTIKHRFGKRAPLGKTLPKGAFG
ncbi:SOS response-associated peptidase family protein [Oscillibacter sp. GMB15532]|uniref:SOS response-associated peptidase family protein n=1 Tax=Oscillibacter sp. GMB15532 TaxID=3230022 RepID=UPI0034DF631F